MAATTDVQPQARMIALEQSRHDTNVGELAGDDVEALAGSIARLGRIYLSTHRRAQALEPNANR